MITAVGAHLRVAILFVCADYKWPPVSPNRVGAVCIHRLSHAFFLIQYPCLSKREMGKLILLPAVSNSLGAGRELISFACICTYMFSPYYARWQVLIGWDRTEANWIPPCINWIGDRGEGLHGSRVLFPFTVQISGWGIIYTFVFVMKLWIIAEKWKASDSLLENGSFNYTFWAFVDLLLFGISRSNYYNF